jgi:hypothetical protein
MFLVRTAIVQRNIAILRVLNFKSSVFCALHKGISTVSREESAIIFRSATTALHNGIF